MVYALVCLKPGENYNYYANHAWPRHSGKVYDELQALARKKLIWYAVAGAWKMSKPSGRKEFKEGRRFYPTHEFLARTVNPKRGAYTWLLDEYNETLREVIELGPGRTSPKEPCVIVCWKKKDLDIATAKINVAKARRSTIAVCGDLDGWREFVEPYKSLVDDGHPACVLHVQDDDVARLNADHLRVESGADVRCVPDEGRVASMALANSRTVESQVVQEVSAHPWMQVSIKSGPFPDRIRPHYSRLNLADDTVVLPVYSPNSQSLEEYRAIVMRHPELTNYLYRTFSNLFVQLEPILESS